MNNSSEKKIEESFPFFEELLRIKGQKNWVEFLMEELNQKLISVDLEVALINLIEATLSLHSLACDLFLYKQTNKPNAFFEWLCDNNSIKSKEGIITKFEILHLLCKNEKRYSQIISPEQFKILNNVLENGPFFKQQTASVTIKSETK